MKASFVLFIFLQSIAAVYGQLNYREYIQNHPLAYTNLDSASIVSSQRILDSLNGIEITEGEDLFLRDIGMTYYFRFAHWQNKKDLSKALVYFQRGFDKYNTSDFAWNLVLYEHVGQCDKALVYLNKYIELRRQKGQSVDYEQVYYIYFRCCGK